MASPLAVRAGLLAGPGLASFAVAVPALLRPRNPYLPVGAEDRVLEVDCQRIQQVVTTDGAVGVASAAAESKEVSQVEVASMDASEELVEDIHRVDARIAAHAGGTAVDVCLVPQCVIALPLLGVAEHLVGVVDLLELLLGLLVTGIAVRVILEGERPIRLLQFVGSGGLCHSKYRVIVI